MADMGGIYALPFTKLILEHPARATNRPFDHIGQKVM